MNLGNTLFQRRIPAVLQLENGRQFEGWHFGYPKNSSGEIVFSTGMVGYPEALTDPSFYGQILTMTFPLVGNYGVVSNQKLELQQRYWESDKIQIFGLIVSNLSLDYSHHNADRSLSEWLFQQKVPGISHIDTRELTKILRQEGTMLAKIHIDDSSFDFYNPNNENLLPKVSADVIKQYGNGKYHLGLIDCGCKNSIIRELTARDFRVSRIPWNNSLDSGEFDGFVISSGPGDPAKLPQIVNTLSALLEGDKPVLGICLGHQLMALASGAKTIKMRYGHRSQNQPVMDNLTRRAHITSQNHGYVVDDLSIPQEWQVWFSNLNDGSNEGLIHKSKPFLSTQFHPEASPGPGDTSFVFDCFREYFK
jgi:carbamoyl-phosphate synthase small subunit